MSDLGTIMDCTSLALSVAKYMGIIQDQLMLEIKQLAGSELEAGLRALEQAANSEHEQQFLLREARNRFNQAISLETDLRLAAAYLGLALCHSHLGDAANAAEAIRNLTQIEPSKHLSGLAAMVHKTPWAAVVVGSVLLPFAAPPLIAAKFAADAAEKREGRHDGAIARLLDLQQQANLLIEQSLKNGSESVFGIVTPSA